MSDGPRQDPLGIDEREALHRVVGKLRARLELDLRRTLEGTYGIRAGADAPEDESRLKLEPDQVAVRAELVGLWEALGRDAERLVREAAFTHANRLVAVRVAEALGLLPESIAAGRRSAGFRQLLEVAPLLGADDDAGYWAYLQLCGDELAADLPRLFDPRSPLLRLRPPPSAVDDLVALVNDATLVKAWGAPDTLGWTYQFFNSDEERSAMRRAHPQPQDSRELAVRNQFFTPDYVVGFLVHNSLGRCLIEGGFAELADELGYLVDRPVPGSAPIDLAGVRVLDPAVGSGHFLLGAYDLLERAWALRGVPAGDAAPMIVEALWGIDIDARAAQVAAAAIVFRARRHRPDGPLPVPNVVCARAVPGGPEARAELLTSVDASRRDFLAELVDQLDRAPELGSLLKVDELLTGDVARRMTYGGGSARGQRRPPTQDTSLMDDAIATGALVVEALVMDVLGQAQAAADQVTSTPAERVLAAEGGDALRRATARAQHYDAVLMNPPFGEPIPGTKTYLKAAYPWLPTKDSNLFAAFVGRGIELCKPDGYVGAITSRAGMFLTTFHRWREEVLLGNDLTVLADLGHKVMHEALVEAAAYVVRRGRPESDRRATFLRLLREAPARRPEALAAVCARTRAGQADERVFRVAPAAFDAVPGSPMAYWVSPDIRRLFTDFPPIEGHSADVRVGLQTGDDFRFVRALWEVDPARIARTREETFAGKRWVPFAKGGEYSPFWSDIHLVVDFERDGEQLRQFPGAVIRNPQYYFRPGLTWPRRTASGFSPRVMPSGCAFADNGPAVIPIADPLTLLGWLGSRTA
ncbi:MAG: Eco57I restriction-modification methylase domain-containing protein, partial [Acidimicrobiales bacterium]